MGKQDMPKGGQEKPKKKEKGPLSPEDLAKKLELAEREKETREKRLEKLRAKVKELFPKPEQAKLREEIERSFDVPQWGEFHTEGILMDTHLEKIFETLDSMRNGIFPEEIPPEARETMRSTVERNGNLLEQYVLLHDISKPDTLRMQFLPSQEGAKGWVWEGGLEQMPEEWALPETGLKDPVALVSWLDKAKVSGISYYHEGPPSFQTKKKSHGDAAAEKIASLGFDGPEDMLTAIRNHEVAYQFTSVKPDTYEKFFATMSPEARDFALVASYIDTTGSLRTDGKPDLTNFLLLLASKENARTIAEVKTDSSKIQGLDPKKVEAFFVALTKTNEVLPSKEDLLARLGKECRPTEYDSGKLKELLAELAAKNVLTADEATEVEALILANNQAELGKKYGKKMKDIRTVMTASEKKR